MRGEQKKNKRELVVAGLKKRLVLKPVALDIYPPSLCPQLLPPRSDKQTSKRIQNTEAPKEASDTDFWRYFLSFLNNIV